MQMVLRTKYSTKRSASVPRYSPVPALPMEQQRLGPGIQGQTSALRACALCYCARASFIERPWNMDELMGSFIQ